MSFRQFTGNGEWRIESGEFTIGKEVFILNVVKNLDVFVEVGGSCE